MSFNNVVYRSIEKFQFIIDSQQEKSILKTYKNLTSKLSNFNRRRTNYC